MNQEKSTDDKSITADIVNCARCGQDHYDLEFKQFRITPVEINDLVFSHWALCPLAKDPILYRIVRYIN